MIPRVTVFAAMVMLFSAAGARAEMIDGPAVIFDTVKGKPAGMLDDGAPVRVLARTGGWVTLALRCDDPGADGLTPVKGKIVLRRKIYGNYGYLNAGALGALRQDKKKANIEIVVHTVVGNLKQKILYFKDYYAVFTGDNKVSFKFSGPIDPGMALATIEKYEKGTATPEGMEGKRLMVEVGYYKGIPTVLRSLDFVSAGGMPTELSVVDFYNVNERGFLKSYHTGYTQVKKGEYHYFTAGACRAWRTEYDIHAPASFTGKCLYIIPSANGSYEIDFSAKMSDEMARVVHSLGIVKYTGANVDLAYRKEAAGIEDAFNALYGHQVYGGMEPAKYGIDFRKEMEWLRKALGY